MENTLHSHNSTHLHLQFYLRAIWATCRNHPGSPWSNDVLLTEPDEQEEVEC